MNPSQSNTLSRLFERTHSALTAVDRATHDVRRALPLLLYSGDQSSFLLAAELVDADTIDELNKLAKDAWSIVVSDQRAQRLGLETSSHSTTCRFRVEGTLTIDDLRRFIDPTAMPEAADSIGSSQDPMLNVQAPDQFDAPAIRLLKHAGLLPAAILIQGTALNLARDEVMTLRLEDVQKGLVQQAQTLRIVSRARVPLEASEQTEIVAFRPNDGNVEHLAVIVGSPGPSQPVLVRIHSECFTGDLLGSLRCDCGNQLRGAIALMSEAGGGVVLYLEQEGRGIGLVNKLRAYRLQDNGRDTVDANLDLGFDEDERDYLAAAEMLKLLGITRVKLLTNNPRKVNALTEHGVDVVQRVEHVFPANTHSLGYLRTKGTRGGHLFNVAQLEQEG
jgi:GTP cyclohydrolase II